MYLKDNEDLFLITHIGKNSYPNPTSESEYYIDLFNEQVRFLSKVKYDKIIQDIQAQITESKTLIIIDYGKYSA